VTGNPLTLLKQAFPFVLAAGIWLTPVPEGLTAPAWHLFAVFVSAIASVLLGAFPLLTSTMLAVGAVVLTRTVSPAKAFGGFANASVLLVAIAFLVANAVVKSGLGKRISLFMVSLFGRSSLGLAYSIVITDALIAPAFPSNTARGGVLYPIVLSVAQGSGSKPGDPEGRRLGGYLMFCGMASLAVSSALWMTATSSNPIGIQIVREYGVEIGFGRWLIMASAPALFAILLLPRVVARIFPPGVGATPDAPYPLFFPHSPGPRGLGCCPNSTRSNTTRFQSMRRGSRFSSAMPCSSALIAFRMRGVWPISRRS
jgi:divalent anion:Na+ symporter, DASS family